MPILTRLALGASAVSALSALGAGLPAAAQPPMQAPARPAPTTATAATAVAAPTTVGTRTHRAASTPKATRVKASRAKASRAKTTRTETTRTGTTRTEARRSTAAHTAPTHTAPAHRRSAARPAVTSTPHAATHTTATHTSATHTTAAHTTAAHTSTAHATAHRSVARPATSTVKSTAKAPAKRSTAAATRTPARPTTPRRVTGGHTSENWSGYSQSAQDLRRAVTSVSASWQVPRAKQRSAGDTEAASDWVGIGGSRGTAGRSKSDPSLIQAGTTTTVGRAGTPNNYAWYETLPTAAVETPLATRSGDRLSVEIGRVGADRWRIRMANATTGRSWSTSVKYAESGSSADFVTERPDTSAGPTNLPTRSATSFRQAKVNGASTRFRPSQRITMTDGSRAVATPSGPEGVKGDGFSVCSYATHCGAGSR